jgi:hypothetical protein
VADTISSRFVPSKLCAHRLGSFMHIDRRRVTKISWNAFVSRRSLSKSSRDYDSSSTTYSRKRMTGVGFSACSTRYASIRLSNSLCQYALPNLYISHFAISIPHMRSRHLNTTYPNMPASTHCRRTYPGRLSFALVVHQSDSDVESRCSKQKQDIE